MPKLRDLRQGIRIAVLGRDVTSIVDAIVSDGVPAEARPQIHRNHLNAKRGAPTMMIETSRPALPSLRSLLTAATDRLGRIPLALVQSMARIAVAAVFWNSGQTKIASWVTTVALFTEEYRVPLLPPEIAAYLATVVELTCPVLLLLGFGARFGAAALLGMTLVIQTFVYPENWVEHLTWATLLLLVLTRGAGWLSVDHLIARASSRNER